ncbi:LacI family DNA-binding transcriptional regulator [Acuticoccus mangrovi]|uniref:Substrate-binding domain-containing protein n=1 Tax=Acuticoccus mangrovi TaxID=2796142 RepID=A0A934IJE4_9HYPH|nr:substrate-binding domain-containing protein [Acuticoccus mangrovi]MBJ3776101.1 substrate-binding domain-containing protein [Acuticoccus mangrovi]
MTRRDKLTIRDVARQAGVSPGSVSRVLNNLEGASPALRARVEAAARELGYELNRAAQTMRGGATNIISCHVSTLENPLVAQIFRAAEERLVEAGYIMIVHGTRYDEERELAALQSDRGRRIDGLLSIAGPMSHTRYREAMDRIGVPVVAVDRDLEAGDVIRVDHAGGAGQAVRHLVGLGHRRIGLLTPRADLVAARRRTEGYRRELARLDLPVDETLIGLIDTAVDVGVTMEAMLGAPEPPTAVIALSTFMLERVLTFARERDIAIPADLSVITIGDSDLARFARPAITTVAWDMRQIGRNAATLLLARVAEAEDSGLVAPYRSFEVPTELIHRASVAAPRLEAAA